ncbi:MAG: bifunctional oligoribonuclease/PAP phosphatase NrnA [Bacteroidota bacterium]|nr:bifunctional oligoribonuclease/PAP phosphatase NrnA [Bacteroidota bacterium]
MLEFEKLNRIVLEYNKFIITTHVNPDADALGSELALYYILKKLGKQTVILNHSETPYNLNFLDTENVIQKYEPEKHNILFSDFDAIMCLDLNRTDRTVSMKEIIEKSELYKVCIDHHQYPADFADAYFIDTDYAATGHILYNFIKATNIVSLDYKISVSLYSAIMTDTGSFRFDRTTPEIHRIAADLLEHGVEPHLVYDQLYDQSLLSKTRLLGVTLKSLKLAGPNDEIAFMTIMQEDFKNLGAVESDTENFVNFGLSIQNVKISILFIELKNGFKVSLRSKGNIHVNNLAREYGGGGHVNASGIRIANEDMLEFIPKILSKAESYL